MMRLILVPPHIVPNWHHHHQANRSTTRRTWCVMSRLVGSRHDDDTSDWKDVIHDNDNGVSGRHIMRCIAAPLLEVQIRECRAGESFSSIFLVSLPKTMQEGMSLPDSCVEQSKYLRCQWQIVLGTHGIPKMIHETQPCGLGCDT